MDNSDVILKMKFTKFVTEYFLKAIESCKYFKIDFRVKDTGIYQCLITLVKKLDYIIKKNFVISISAEVIQF